MNGNYGRFAAYYDSLTFDVNYDEIADFLEKLFRKNGVKPELVLDLACGTGSLSHILSRRGYDMIGIDGSEEMLGRAIQKDQTGKEILFLHQSMQEFELFGTVDAIVCVLDSFNYITDYEELKHIFHLCHNYLNPNGVLLFDINSAYKFQHILADNTYAYETDEIFYVWENDFIEEEQLCDFYLTFFVKDEEGKYERFDESHTERCYTHEQITQALSEAGFRLNDIYDGYQTRKACNQSERIFYECVKE